MANFRIESGTLPSNIKTIGFEAQETLGRPFTVEVYLTAEDAGALELLPVVGTAASLIVELPDQDAMAFRGKVSGFSLLRMEGRLSLYRATLSPRVATLADSRHSRVFTKVALKDIVTEILQTYQLSPGTDFELSITDPPPVQDHLCQYKESDLDFLHRWMEREGWTYFFDHEGDVEKMKIVDAKSSHTSLRQGPVRYFPQHEGDVSARDSFRELARKSAATAATVRIADYDYMKPALDVVGTAEVSAQGLGELSTYGARVFTPDTATRLARLRAEEIRARAVTYHAIGAAAQLRAGYTFELNDHPRGSMNQKYLVTAARHIGVEPSLSEPWGGLLPEIANRDVYTVELQAIEEKTQFRAVSSTPWPRVDGFENAKVDGPIESEYAQLDADGRYLVRFHFDERANPDGEASERIRMAQPHGGSIEGFHFPLRKGTEVICAFLGGDPDRPVISGVVPNTNKPSKVVQTNRTQNIAQTGSGNYFTLEDQQNSEWLSVYTPAGKMQANLYLGNPRSDGDFALTSQAAPEVTAKGKNAADLGAPAAQLWTTGSIEVAAKCNLNAIAGGQFQIEAQGGEYRTYSASNFYLDVVGAAKETYWGTLTYKVDGVTKIHLESTENTHVQKPASYTHNNTLTETVTGDVTEMYGATKTQHVFQSDMEMVLGNRTFERKTYKSEITGGDVQFVLGNQTVTSTAGEKIEIQGPKEEKTGGNVVLNATTQMKWSLPANTFKADYFSMFKSSALILRSELVLGGHKESSVVGVAADLWMGYRIALAATAQYETQKIKITVTGAEARIHARKYESNILSFSTVLGNESKNYGSENKGVGLKVLINVLHSKT